MYSITADVNVDYKKLKVLQTKGLIKIASMRIENNKDRVSAFLPTGTLGHTALGYMRLGSAKQTEIFNKLKDIIGVNNLKDCLHLEGHIRDGRDYFVTEDNDILGKRNELQKEFPELKIRSVDELISELNA